MPPRWKVIYLFRNRIYKGASPCIQPRPPWYDAGNGFAGRGNRDNCGKRGSYPRTTQRQILQNRNHPRNIRRTLQPCKYACTAAHAAGNLHKCKRQVLSGMYHREFPGLWPRPSFRHRTGWKFAGTTPGQSARPDRLPRVRKYPKSQTSRRPRKYGE